MLARTLSTSLWLKSKLWIAVRSVRLIFVSFLFPSSQAVNGWFNLYWTFSALQLTYPRSKIPTLREVFEFAGCADPQRQISWNIESKINPILPSKTRGVADFVSAQHKEFVDSLYSLSQITVRYFLLTSKCSVFNNNLQYQSFDWRTLIAMKVCFYYLIRWDGVLTGYRNLTQE